MPCTPRGTEVLFPKQGLRMRQVLPKSDRYNVGAYLCHCMTVRLLGIVRVHVLQSDI
jgi:hypothetical protein